MKHSAIQDKFCTLESWAKRTGTEQQGFQFVALDRNLWQILTSDGLCINIEQSDDLHTVFMYVPIMLAQGLGEYRIFRAVLETNLFMIESCQGALAYDANSQEILFCRNFNFFQMMRYEDFCEILGLVTNAIPLVKNAIHTKLAHPPEQLAPTREVLSAEGFLDLIK